MTHKQRNLFEASAREIIPGIPAVDGFRRNAHGEYCTVLLQLAWEMWCAAITSPADIVTVLPSMSLEWQTAQLIRRAYRQGRVVTITLRPLKPLAMGKHQMVADFRDRR